MANCIKNCKCDECEMLETNYPIVFYKMYGLTEKRLTLVGYKCKMNACCAETKEDLKYGKTYMDNVIFLGSE